MDKRSNELRNQMKEVMKQDKERKKQIYIMTGALTKVKSSPLYNKLDLGDVALIQRQIKELARNHHFKELFEQDKTEGVYKIILNMLNAAKNTFPPFWSVVFTNHVGVNALLIALPEMVEHAIQYKSLEQRFFEKAFQRVDPERFVQVLDKGYFELEYAIADIFKDKSLFENLELEDEQVS